MSDQQLIFMPEIPREGTPTHAHDPKDCWCWQKTAHGTYRTRPLREGEGKPARRLIVPGLDGKEKRRRRNNIRKLTNEMLPDLPPGEHDVVKLGIADKKGRILWSPELAEKVLAWTADGLSFKKLVTKLGCTALDFWRVLDAEGNESFKEQYQQAFEYGLRAEIDDLTDILQSTELSDTAIRRASEIAKHLRWYGERMIPKIYGERKYTEGKVTHEVGGRLATALTAAAEARKALPAPAVPLQIPEPSNVIDITPEPREPTQFDES